VVSLRPPQFLPARWAPLIAGATALLLVAAAGGWWLASRLRAPVDRYYVELPDRPVAASDATMPARSTVETVPRPGGVEISAESIAPATAPAVPELPSYVELALVEPSADGLLPVVAANGRSPAQAYARPFDAADPRPRIAVVVTGLGMNRAATSLAVGLPGEVTLAFSAYAEDLDEWMAKARAAGHEALLELPMQPANYPNDDPGPWALLTDVEPEANLARLHRLLARFAGYVGVTDNMGGAFAASEPHLVPVMAELKRRGLLFLDRQAAYAEAPGIIAARVGLPRIAADIQIDAEPSRAAILSRLNETQDHARRDGAAVAVAEPYPLSLTLVGQWLAGLGAAGIAAAPLTALVATAGQ